MHNNVTPIVCKIWLTDVFLRLSGIDTVRDCLGAAEIRNNIRMQIKSL